MVNVFFVQIHPAANALSPSDVQVPVELSSTSNVQSCDVLVGPRKFTCRPSEVTALLATPDGSVVAADDAATPARARRSRSRCPWCR